MGEAPDAMILVETVDDVETLEVPDPEKLAFISQTTLSVDETKGIIEALKAKFPAIIGPRTDDICYATTNRQASVKELAKECDVVLVIGSTNSSNSNRLVDVTRDLGTDAYLIDNASQVKEEWLEGKPVVGITSGASAPDELVQNLVQVFRDRGTTDIGELEVIQENMRFMLPKEIRVALADNALPVAK
jgi:4-hydroxy-3-methylbut-2-enyl diphosphate reductase